MDELIKKLTEERDEARAEVEHAYREGGALYEAKIAEREAFRRGAEAMREACAKVLDDEKQEWGNGGNVAALCWKLATCIRALPIPEEQ